MVVATTVRSDDETDDDNDGDAEHKDDGGKDICWPLVMMATMTQTMTMVMMTMRMMVVKAFVVLCVSA